MKIKYIAASLFVVLLFAIGCESMDDNYKEYLGEYNYSGKIQNLRVYPGFERVVLAWDNPKDQKSKSIRVIYGADDSVVEYDSMVDSVSIDGLTDGTGYDFTVYTLDAHNNISVPVSLTAFPISNEFVESLTPPTLVVDVKNNEQVLSLIGLSNIQMTFSGIINLQIDGSDGFSASANIDISDNVHGVDDKGNQLINVLNEYSIPVADLGIGFLAPGKYSFSYKVNAWPVMGNQTSIDIVELSRETTIDVTPIIINITSLGGTVSDQHNKHDHEGIEKLVDGNLGTKYLVFQPTTWAQFKGNKPSIVTKYSLVSGNDAPGRDPKDWTLYGSNDGENWTVLDVRKDITFVSRRETREFEIDNNELFQYYKLDITRNNGDGLFQLAEWTLYGPKLE